MKYFLPGWEKFLSQSCIYICETKALCIEKTTVLEAMSLNTNEQENHIREMFIS